MAAAPSPLAIFGLASAAAANPLASPAAFDAFELDSIIVPFALITECNGVKWTWQEQQAPGFQGAFLVGRGVSLTTITYSIPVWTAAGFGSYAVLSSYMRSIAKKLQGGVKQTMRLTDLRLRDMGRGSINVVLEVLPFQSHPEPGTSKWLYNVQFHQYAGLKFDAGPARAPTGREGEISATLVTIKGQKATLAAAAGSGGKPGAWSATAKAKKL